MQFFQKRRQEQAFSMAISQAVNTYKQKLIKEGLNSEEIEIKIKNKLEQVIADKESIYAKIELAMQHNFKR